MGIRKPLWMRMTNLWELSMIEHRYLSNEELSRVHQKLLELLLEFDAICQKHHISYFLGGGTLLGAIRHGGFIPWDDDIDVMMLREEYDRFCAIPQTDIPDYLFIQTYQTDPYYHGDMAKLRLKHTAYETEFSAQFPQMQNGFFIDIFAHDKTSQSVPMQQFHIFTTRLARSLVFHKWAKTPMQFYGKHRCSCFIMDGIKKFLPMCSLEYFREFVLKYYQRSNSQYLYDGMGQHLTHGAFPAKWLEQTIQVSFEGHQFPAPAEYDKYLAYSYGDYKKIPDESEKHFHKIYRIDFGSKL